MSKNLVIVESPAKAKTIEKFLGKDFKVVSSNGHIADLPSKELGINIDNNYEPKYIVNSVNLTFINIKIYILFIYRIFNFTMIFFKFI